MGRIFEWIRGVIRKMFNLDRMKDAVQADIAMSSEMQRAIEVWEAMYLNSAEYLNKDGMRSLNLAAYIASALSQLSTLEAEITVEGSPRADYLAQQVKPVIDGLRRYVEYACATGGMIFKPYVDIEKRTIEVDFVQASDFAPIAFNSRGEITSVAFVETKTVGKQYFRRIEKHTLDGSIYTVINKAFQSSNKNDLGREVPLSAMPEWALIEPSARIGNIKAPLFSYLKMPFANNVDPASPLGVSVYAKATDLIEDADKQYSSLLWEYKGGEMAIDVSKDVFPIDEEGNAIIPSGRERLFRPNRLDQNAQGTGSGDLIKTFAPTLRDANYLSGLAEILRQIEDKCGLARGTLTEPSNQAKTATEIKMLQQRSYVTVTDIQGAIEAAFDGLLMAMDTLATLYKLAPMGKYTTTYSWDDSVITDSESERLRDKDDVSAGLMKKWEYRVKWYGEDEATAKKMVGDGDEQSDDDLLFRNNPLNTNKGDPNANA